MSDNTVHSSISPFLVSVAAATSLFGGAMALHDKPYALFVILLGFVVMAPSLFSWWKNLYGEVAVSEGSTTKYKFMKSAIRLGFACLIVSEIMFFFGFFWSFLKSMFFPITAMDSETLSYTASLTWPPTGIKAPDYKSVPFLNTLILLLSGGTITWAHHALSLKSKKTFFISCLTTIVLGILFTTLQITEYRALPFKLAESGLKSNYSGNFYVATGFHGLHVIIGTLFIIVCFIIGMRQKESEMKPFLGFDCAAWYWHFVDVVWLFLYLFLYVIGS